MSGGRQPVASLAAGIGAHDLRKPKSTEVEHLPVEVLEFIQEGAALAARPRLEMSGLTVRDEINDRRGHLRSPSSSAAW